MKRSWHSSANRPFLRWFSRRQWMPWTSPLPLSHHLRPQASTVVSLCSLPVHTASTQCPPIQPVPPNPCAFKPSMVHTDHDFRAIIESPGSDAGRALTQFDDLMKQFARFSDECVDTLFRTSPRPCDHDPPLAISGAGGSGSFIKRGARFPCVDDYAHFSLLSIINHHLHQYLFLPFHPCSSSLDNEALRDEYSRFMMSNHQLNVGKWRSQKFRSLEAVMSEDRKIELMHKLLRSIENDWIAALSVIVDQRDIPCLSDEVLTTLLQQAYDWNCIIKGEITQYNFEPFTMMPGTTWDPVSMQVFERLRGPVHPASTIVSVVSLGIRATVALGGSQDSQVQREIRVLVDEWLRDTKVQATPLVDTSTEVDTTNSVPQASCSSHYACLSCAIPYWITFSYAAERLWGLVLRILHFFDRQAPHRAQNDLPTL
ncbi:hypothetical protein DL93DRAFT_606527 [Clavulina sp. PMI_390]|nr:hypothetical protein DL93DRAFT_606527 [Clavulina sp. PMI_390]